jgi:WD40 repeat protein
MIEALIQTESTNYYRIGGTLAGDAACYVRRHADETLYQQLRAGEYCYILTARQMGKSSLMVRTAARLRQTDEMRVVMLDLSALGNNISPEQWYLGQIRRFGRQFDLEEELDDFWEGRTAAGIGPLQRWMDAIEKVVLPSISGSLVVFIDEIDVCRSLPFPTDEFFAAIRACYNRSSNDPVFRRLTFCLIGVATPSDLMEDKRATPFNIARCIELNDFRHEEAAHLIAGLQNHHPPAIAQTLLDRILYWTNGHPYLTQRLCLAVTSGKGGGPLAFVDGCCEEIFFGRSAIEREDNLLFVRDRLLFGQTDVAGLLSLYRQVRRGQRVMAESGPLSDALRLSGLCSPTATGILQVRNRIYQRVFDEAWVRSQMPDAELHRQRVAFQRGMVRAMVGSGVVIAALGGLSFSLKNALESARSDRDLANRALSVAQLNLAQRAINEGNAVRAEELLHNLPSIAQGSFAQRFLWRLSHNEQQEIPGNEGPIVCSSAPDKAGNFAAVHKNGRITLWNRHTSQIVRTVMTTLGSTPATEVIAAAFSPDGKQVALVGNGTDLEIWEVATGRRQRILPAQKLFVTSMAFTADGKYLGIAEGFQSVDLWDVQTSKPLRRIVTPEVRYLAFSPSGRFLATGSLKGGIRLFEIATGHQLWERQAHQKGVTAEVFSPNERVLATGSDDHSISLWNTASGAPEGIPLSTQERIFTLAFSPDGSRLAAGTRERTVFNYNVSPLKEEGKFIGHSDIISTVVFTPDSNTLSSSSLDGTVRFWNLSAPRLPVLGGSLQPNAPTTRYLMTIADDASAIAFCPEGTPDLIAKGRPQVVQPLEIASNRRTPPVGEKHTQIIWDIALSPDGHQIATASADKTIALWDVTSGRLLHTLGGDNGIIMSVIFSRDGHYLASSNWDNTVAVWDSTNGSLVARFFPPTADDAAQHAFSLLGTGTPRKAALAFSPDGRTLAVQWERDPVIHLIDYRRQRQSVLPIDKDKTITVLVFSPDGNLLAGGTEKDTIYIWEPATGKQRFALNGHVGWVDALAFSHNSQTLVSGGMDGFIKLWDPVIGQELVELPVERHSVEALAFDKGDHRLISLNQTGDILSWEP